MHRLAALVRPPSVRALLIQLFSFSLVFIAGAAIEARTGMAVSVTALAWWQGAVAALLSCRLRLAPWWWLIQLIFPVALLAGPMLRIPPVVFLLLFLVFLALYWSTFRTQVPFFPSGPATRDAVAALLPPDAPIRFVDIGSGLGDLVLDLAGRRPDCRFAGIELAPLPWLISMLRAKLRASRATFMRGDYTTLDLARYDVVFAYLSPAAMPDLWRQARAQMRPGSLLLSYEFGIPGSEPDIAGAPDGRGASLYGWRM